MNKGQRAVGNKPPMFMGQEVPNRDPSLRDSIDQKAIDESKSQVSYNPYSQKDYKKIVKQTEDMKLARGLGHNMGDETWEQAKSKFNRQNEFS